MKYGESAFIVAYLITAAALGVLILRKAKTKAAKLMGISALVLCSGDAFHLVPRVIAHFSSGDLSLFLGVGKLVTSLTMTVFYLLVYYVYVYYYKKNENKRLALCLWALVIIRAVLCAFPQNGWTVNSTDATWGIIRNIPFVILGAIVAYLYFKERKSSRAFRFIWLYICLSFAFYIPVAVFAGMLPVLGMLMIPKTVCYVLILFAFYKEADKT